jgi:ABC-type multidrug transport system, ATPase and permease components
MKKVKDKKEKPKYNMFQNTAYGLKNIWDSGQKMLAVTTIVQIPIAIMLTVIGLYTSPIILNRLEFSNTTQQMVAVIIALLAGKMIFELINNFTGAKQSLILFRIQGYYTKLRNQKFLDVDYECLEDPKFQDISEKASAATNGNGAAIRLFHHFSHIVENILTFVFLSGVISMLNPLILLLLILTSLINYFTMKAVKNYEHKMKDPNAAVNRKINYLGYVTKGSDCGKDIRLYGMADWLHNMSKIFMGEQVRLKKGAEYRWFGADLINFLLTLLRDGGAYIYLIYMAVAGNISAGEFVLYFGAIGQCTNWLGWIIQEWSSVHEANLQFCDIREMLEFPNKTNRGKGIDLPKNSDGLSIELKNVSYTYPEAEAPTIKNLSLKIEPGEKIAVVGLNGAGKTTLVKLICGMYMPTDGDVLVDGHKVNEYNIHDYHSLFAAVFQTFRFLALSIAQNITIVPKNQADIKKLEKCVQLAGLQEKLNKLELGIDTPLIKEINPDGTELSGGEQQKVMLARAIYKDAPILILDEPTAALDPIAESELYMKYNEIARDKTSVFISHRLASTRFCDRIVLINDGEIAEIGSHNELLKKGGKYAELFEIQSHYYRDNVEEEIS